MFLGRIERLLSEGQFVATYKYALLVALANVAVEYGSDAGGELDIPISRIAEEFIELYWRQSSPYGAQVADAGGGILAQTTGAPAKIFTIIRGLRRNQTSLAGARKSPAWVSAVREAERLVTQMPLWKLQYLRKDRLEFLYSEAPEPGHIRLRSGVAANFRRFHGMIVRLVQAEWLRFVQGLPRNASMLGPTSDLSDFLFGSERAALTRMLKPLTEIQDGSCFYCRKTVGDGDIDHFVAWSRYPRDLAHNLVLARKNCNRYKSDLLAAEVHLERWSCRNEDKGAQIGEAGRVAGIPVDLNNAISVAAWAYAHGDQLHAATWIQENHVEPLSGRWKEILAPFVAAPPLT